MSITYDIHDLRKGALPSDPVVFEAAFGEHRRASTNRGSDHLRGAAISGGVPWVP